VKVCLASAAAARQAGGNFGLGPGFCLQEHASLQPPIVPHAMFGIATCNGCLTSSKPAKLIGFDPRARATMYPKASVRGLGPDEAAADLRKALDAMQEAGPRRSFRSPRRVK
jgi:hypothetical protein